MELSKFIRTLTTPCCPMLGAGKSLAAMAFCLSSALAQTQISPPAPVSISAPTPPPAPLLKPRPFTVQTDYGEGNAIANALRNSPPKLYTFDRASLSDVLRFLADDAGIPFVSMQSRIPAEAGGSGGGATSSIDEVLVTFTMRASPFLVLESIAKANDVALVYENGVWFLRPYNEFELIGRIYKLRFTPQERVNFNTGPGATSTAGGSSQSGTLSTATIVVQQPVFIYEVQEPAIVAEIRNMLRIQSSGVTGKVAGGVASVENFPPIPANTGLNPAGSRIAPQTPPVVDQPSVTFNSDTNTIYVIATRQQHQWIEGFLAAADQPQDLIGIEVKFFETTRNPIQDLGINWFRTFGADGGWGVNLNQELTGTGNVGFQVDNESNRGFNRNQTDTSVTQSGSGSGILPGGALNNYGYNSSDFDSTVNNITSDIYNSIRGYNAGMGAAYTAVLSPDTVGFTIEAFMQDSDTNLVQYPRVLTVNNREVAISNSRNIPILLGGTTNSSGGTSTQTSEVQYLPVGTQLNILPKTMPDGSVTLNVAITVSNESGAVDLSLAPGQSNSYPITASRVYQASLQVNSGYTLAVGGLEEALDREDNNGVLFLKDVPVLGQLFKSKGRNLNKRNLVIFITPSVIRDRARTTGISETPSTLPVRPGDPEPPSFGQDGRLVGGIEALDNALSWLAFQNDLFLQINRESRATRETIKQLEGVIRTAEMILAEIEILGAKFPKRAGQLADREEQARSLIGKLKDTLTKTRKNLF